MSEPERQHPSHRALEDAAFGQPSDETAQHVAS
jgi:hypothetical protein